MDTNTDHIELEADWMTDREIALARGFWRGVKEMLEKRNIDFSPLLALSIDEVLKAYILMKRFESFVAKSLATLAQKSETPPDSGKEKNTRMPSTKINQLVDTLGRARGRLLKAVREIEKSFGPRKPQGPAETRPVVFADLLKPILEKADGVLEEALGPEFAQLARNENMAGTGP